MMFFWYFHISTNVLLWKLSSTLLKQVTFVIPLVMSMVRSFRYHDLPSGELRFFGDDNDDWLNPA